MIGIDNSGRINDTYDRGAQPDGRDYTDLAALGVTAVIDLQQDGLATERRLVEKQYNFGADVLHPEFTQFVHN